MKSWGTKACVMRAWLPVIGLALVALASGSPAAAERLVASVSNHRVQVSSSFTGEELVLFGSIEHTPNDPERRGGSDLIATVSGPRQNLETFRREPVLGIGRNSVARIFSYVAGSVAVSGRRRSDRI